MTERRQRKSVNSFFMKMFYEPLHNKFLSVFEHYRYSGKATFSEEKEQRKREKSYIRRILLSSNAIKSFPVEGYKRF